MNRALLLLASLGAVLAAPHYHDHHHGHFRGPPAPFRGHYDPFSDDLFGGDVFDTNRFWAQLSRDLEEMERALQEFTRHFPTGTSQSGVQGNQYSINITLIGYQESDIVVKAKDCLLMIQAVHTDDGGNQRHYMDVRTLPSNVNVSGSWTYDGQTLRIVFPLSATTTTEVSTGEQNTEFSGTQAPEFNPEVANTVESKENMEPTGNENVGDADVGGDRELMTNEISGSSVEATTYAVDLKNEVEFVPVKY
ncbi:hypothetical protein EVAR_44039_1 [Eumeta japonica]|uniref:SHSP domain-containing protein n=1 Tax=Eumeta variegata TaxID=151549 RepID=A0A4C1XGH0_EUMVA|nr:hypothetical protein EVAR_44039_1 [Eumeta japonica]